ncbi:unnamed protein product [Moneuplotes crassus]|uniref:Uncharacterized protein n=1 Tax=Euplotes crassus TaxID=5936 RepID=A0AAD1XUC8_EUPCR|nr:unnamed protein product [Moneuplotes crassus]
MEDSSFNDTLDFETDLAKDTPENHELDTLKGQIEDFLTEKPEIERKLEEEKAKLKEASRGLQDLKAKVEENSIQLNKNKIDLDNEIQKKDKLEENLLEVEAALDKMRKELKWIIKSQSGQTYIEPEGYREFKKDANLKILNQLQEESTSITRTVRRRQKVALTNYQCVEQKVEGIDKLLLKITHKEDMFMLENEKLQETQARVQNLREELLKTKMFKYMVYLVCGILLMLSIVCGKYF